jgi:low affinity Fe/Cu permease
MTAPNSQDFPGQAAAMPSTTAAGYPDRSPLISMFDRFASAVTRGAGSPLAFSAALVVVIVWALCGPFFHYSENWQLIINTGTTIVTFLMVFLIQQSQNKDSVAIHLKLNELLASNRSASNRMIGIESMDEQDLREVAQFYARLSAQCKERGVLKEAHSIDEEGMPTG